MSNQVSKILVVSSTYPATEVEAVPRFIYDQMQAFRKADPSLTIVVLAPHNQTSQRLDYPRRINNVTEERFHYFFPGHEQLTDKGIMSALRQSKLNYMLVPFLILMEFIALYRLTRKHKPDLLYAHWFMPQALASAFVSKLTGTPFIFTTHASDVSVLRKFPFSRHLVRLVCKQASAYTAVSKRTAEKLKQSFDEADWKKNFSHKLSIIPMGVTTKVPHLGKEIIIKAREKYGIPRGKQYVLFIGRLAEKKGVSYLINAIANLDLKTSRKLHFIVAGDGQLKPSLEERAKQLNIQNITFTGYVHGTDKDALLQLADLTCFPSIIDSMKDSEGFPVAIMESLAASKVVLASNVSGGETVIRNGINGFIFNQKSAADLTETIIEASLLSTTEKKRIGIESRKLATQFDWDTITKKHGLVFKKALQ